MTRSALVLLQMNLAASTDPVVAWNRETAQELLNTADLVDDLVETNTRQAREIEQLRRRILDIESELAVARAGIPRAP